jgi:hypothetical protein
MFVKGAEHYNSLRNGNTKLLDEYKDNMLLYLKTSHPEMPEAKLIELIDEQIKLRFSDKVVKITAHLKENNDYKIQDGSLLKLTDNMRAKSIYSPNGCGFESAEKEVSLHSDFTLARQAKRKVVKKKMFAAEVEKREADLFNLNTEQMNIKIEINAVSGLLRKMIFFKSDSIYNAITATTRFGISLGFASIERFVAGNLYFDKIDDVIGYITSLIRIYPSDEIINKLRSKYNMYQPSIDDLYTYFITNGYQKYALKTSQADRDLYSRLIDKLTDNQRLYIFYALSFHNIVMYNKDAFIDWNNHILDLKYQIADKYKGLTEDDITNPRSISEIDDETLSTMITTLCLDLVDYKPLKDIKSKVDITCMMDIHDHTKAYIEDTFSDIFEYFFNIDHLLHDVFGHREMMRNTVIGSDTDSSIFTIQKFIETLCGSLAVTDKSLSTCAIVTFIIFKHLEHIFNLFSIRVNADEANYKKIQIKNEFLYPVFLRSLVKKQYIGLIAIREGNYLSPLKLDMKGLEFKKSNLSHGIKDKFNKWITDILQIPCSGKQISIEDIKQSIIAFEDDIIESTNNDNTYFYTIPINDKAVYKFPEKSAYFNYELYQEVFQDFLNESVMLPTKFFKIPLKSTIKYSNCKDKLKSLKEANPEIFNKFEAFLKKYPAKSISTLYLPTSIKTMPDIIKPLINYSAVVEQNMNGFYIVLAALGFGFIDEKNKVFTLHDFMKEGE